MITYIIKSNVSGDLYKIGRTKDLQNRLQQIRGSMPNVRFIVVFCIDGDFEDTLHKQFADKRVDREWFELSDDEIMSIVSEYSDRKYLYSPQRGGDDCGVIYSSRLFTENFDGLNSTDLVVLFKLAMETNYNSPIVRVEKYMLDVFALHLGKCTSYIRNCINRLSKTHLLTPQKGRGAYKINSDYLWHGDMKKKHTKQPQWW
jgi:hypothetical protein